MANRPVDLARVIDRTRVWHAHYLPETDSTNTVALQRAGDLSPDQSELVYTACQLQGRGRGANRWYSSDGALTFSLITRQLDIPPSETPRVSLAVGLAVCRAVEPLAPAALARIKWPNDVYLSGKKAAGILIEIPASSPGRFVVGIGLNVSNSLDGAPEEVRQLAASLAQFTHEELDPTGILISLLGEIDADLSRLVEHDPLLSEEWRARSLLIGRRVRVSAPPRVIEGVCVTIADDGALVLETDNGPTPCYGGVVEWFSGG
ncbi:MAG: biotin--[acetyl-CoA-carboxylase] ligase [Planctomycetales bacterium]|nr:biotin--[acetyl-CoA-carboxylase] ligase [Planctomycetales bacterium]